MSDTEHAALTLLTWTTVSALNVPLRPKHTTCSVCCQIDPKVFDLPCEFSARYRRRIAILRHDDARADELLGRDPAIGPHGDHARELGVRLSQSKR